MKKYIQCIISSLFFLFITFTLVGCSPKTVDEDIIRDAVKSSFLSSNDTIDEFEILERKTDKNQKTDSSFCKIKYNDKNISYEEYYQVDYILFGEKWVFNNAYPYKEKEWLSAPMTGVSEDFIRESIIGIQIPIDNENWEVTSENVQSIKIVSQDTQLEQKTDSIIAAVELSSEVLTAKGEITLDFVFDNLWTVKKANVSKNFKSSYIKGKEFKPTSEELITKIVECPLPVKSIDQEIEIKAEDVSGFAIKNTTISNRGTNQTLECVFTVDKPMLSIETIATLDYYYESDYGWVFQEIVNEGKIKSVNLNNLKGRWTGYIGDVSTSAADTQCIMDITEVADDGKIKATLQYPSQNYSCITEGFFDVNHLTISLNFTEWIQIPQNQILRDERHYEPYLSGLLYIEENILESDNQPDKNEFNFSKSAENSVSNVSSESADDSEITSSTNESNDADIVAPNEESESQTELAIAQNSETENTTSELTNYTVNYAGTSDPAGYLFPESSDFKFEGFAPEYEAWVYQYGVNEIYAKHGYSFQTPQVSELFSSKSWYVPDSGFNESVFSEIEKYNIDFLSQCMSATGQDGGYGIPSGNHINAEAIESNTVENNIQTGTHYENQYFAVDVPADWANAWILRETDNSLNGIISTKYEFSFGESSESTPAAGGAIVYVIDMSDHSRPLSHYSRMIPENVTSLGTASGENEVFMTEAGAGFFTRDQGATITLK